MLTWIWICTLLIFYCLLILKKWKLAFNKEVIWVLSKEENKTNAMNAWIGPKSYRFEMGPNNSNVFLFQSNNFKTRPDGFLCRKPKSFVIQAVKLVQKEAQYNMQIKTHALRNQPNKVKTTMIDEYGHLIHFLSFAGPI